MAPEVIVVGGGITGLATAHALAGAGVRVRLLERRALGAMASGWTLGGVRQSGRDPANRRWPAPPWSAGANWAMCSTPTQAIAAAATCAWRAARPRWNTSGRWSAASVHWAWPISPPHPRARPNPSPCTDRT